MSGTNTIKQRKNVCLKIKMALIVCVKEKPYKKLNSQTKRKIIHLFNENNRFD